MSIDRKDRPHAVSRVLDVRDGRLLRHAVSQIEADGSFSPKHDPKTERFELVERFEGFDAAAALRVRLQRTQGKYTSGVKIDLPEFLPQLPSHPRERRESFLALDIEDQEELFYSTTVLTGLPRHRIMSWLMVVDDDIRHIDIGITDAARAELDLRIAKKMVNHALKDNGVSTIVPTLFLSKVFLRWTEQGIDADGVEMTNASKALFDDLTIVQTHRNVDGTTTAPPTHLSVVQKAKQA